MPSLPEAHPDGTYRGGCLLDLFKLQILSFIEIGVGIECKLIEQFSVNFSLKIQLSQEMQGLCLRCGFWSIFSVTMQEKSSRQNQEEYQCRHEWE
jgi:hypothetical protein